MSDSEHPLRYEWAEFKRFQNEGVETARTNHTEINGQLVPCVRVLVTDDASTDFVADVKDCAADLNLCEWTEEHSQGDEYIFVQEEHIEQFASVNP